MPPVTAPPRPAVHVAPVRRTGSHRRTPGWWRDAVGFTAWMSLLVVVALWVANRGVQNADTLPGLATSLGRLAGLLSADLLLCRQVLLMARIPWVERGFGQDALVRTHRLVGFTSFHLLLAHIVLIVVGYAADAHTGLPAQAWSLVTTYPGMLLATAATVLLVMVVVTSVRAARRRLRYESWHLLHLYAYLGVGLALPHEIWTGADFTASPLAAGYWWSVYAAAAGAVLVFRIFLPGLRNLRHRLVVDQVCR
ncbi:ferric reductase-like transmembrane domain-containing protein [Fodinicola feengrottensis]|uniref:ferric reductase-like transmembrane domain-containing protein n=1 Tax=Fodinicola feengrottensis TaxID=435914 RepID=UPI00244305B1|nr:ferric reductase-like transmembrane domain-containing protein [Fodinicola feengrottensis]